MAIRFYFTTLSVLKSQRLGPSVHVNREHLTCQTRRLCLCGCGRKWGGASSRLRKWSGKESRKIIEKWRGGIERKGIHGKVVFCCAAVEFLHARTDRRLLNTSRRQTNSRTSYRLVLYFRTDFCMAKTYLQYPQYVHVICSVVT